MEAPEGPTWDVENLFTQGRLDPVWGMPETASTLESVETADVAFQNTRGVNATIERAVLTECDVRDSTLKNATIDSCLLENVNLYNCVVTNSKGAGLDGETIMSVDSELVFEHERESDIPTFLNMTLILVILPLVTLPTIIASYSIVGEKNNKSLEPILASPTTDGELLLGKVLSAFVPSMTSTLGAVVVGRAIINVFLSQLGEPLLPNLTWVLGVLLLAPLAMLAISGAFAAANGGLYYFAKAIFNMEDILVRWA